MGEASTLLLRFVAILTLIVMDYPFFVICKFLFLILSYLEEILLPNVHRRLSPRGKVAGT
jgi:hypothetical protein